jgi:hypothetical protein
MAFTVSIQVTPGQTLPLVLTEKFATGMAFQVPGDPDNWLGSSTPECIHGYEVFSAYGSRIEQDSSVRWIVFLSEPLAAAVAHFRNLQKLSPQQPLPIDDLSVYLLQHHEPNLLSRVITRTGRRWDQLEFVGITELFDLSMDAMFHALGWDPIDYEAGGEGLVSLPVIPSPILKLFQEKNANDYELYALALKKLLAESAAATPMGDASAVKKQLDNLKS